MIVTSHYGYVYLYNDDDMNRSTTINDRPNNHGNYLVTFFDADCNATHNEYPFHAQAIHMAIEYVNGTRNL